MRRLGTGLILLTTLVGVAGISVVEGATARSRPALETLSFEVGLEAVTVFIKTSEPVPAFRCTLTDDDARSIAIDIGGVDSRLFAKYALESAILPEISVTPGAGATDAVRILLPVREGRLAQLETIAQGLLLRFEKIDEAGGSSAAADPDAYRVGVGDKLGITVFGHPDLSLAVEVRGDGSINYPLVGDVHVAGQTPAEIDERITGILAKDYLVDPEVGVEVREYQSQWVTVIGMVRSPGRYVLRRDMRLIDLLAQAGGATADAGPEILITRRSGADGEQQFQVDRDKLLTRDNLEANITLKHGDIVTLGEKQVFYIRGEVSRPGAYVLERGMTVLKAISVAGGFSQFANRKEIEILRTGENQRAARVRVNLKAVEAGKQPDVNLEANDTVVVPRRIF